MRKFLYCLFVLLLFGTVAQGQLLQHNYEHQFLKKIKVFADSAGNAPHALYIDQFGYVRRGGLTLSANNYPTAVTFNPVSKILTLNRQGMGDLSDTIPYPSQLALSVTGGGATLTGSYPNLTLNIPGYTLPAATTTSLGGIRVGSGLQVSNGLLSTVPVSLDLTNLLRKDSNLSDLTNKALARSNLGLALVASSGNYLDLINRPTIPTGTVTSVGLLSSDLLVTGSPVTSAGNITANIGLNKVTFAKFQQINSGLLLGRYNAGTGNIETIALGNGLTLNNGVLSSTAAGVGTVTSVGLFSNDLVIGNSPITSNGLITADIGANKVTFPKMQQIGTGSILGRYNAGTGNIESIVLGNGFAFSGNVLNTLPYSLPTASASTLGGIKIGSGLSIDAGGVVSVNVGGVGTVTSVGISSTDLLVSNTPITSAGNITANIGLNKVTFAKIQQINANTLMGRSTSGTGNVESIGIGSGLVMANGILSATSTSNGTVTSVDFTSTDLTVTGGPITGAGSFTANIGANKVTFAKMQQIGTGSILGRYNAGTGNIESIAIGAGLNLSAGTLTANPYLLPKATTGVLGGVIVGAGLQIDGNGVLSAIGGASVSGTNKAPAGPGQIYAGKVGEVLEFRSLESTTGEVEVLTNGSTVDLRLNGTLLKTVAFFCDNNSQAFEVLTDISPNEVIIIDLDYAAYSASTNARAISGQITRSFAMHTGGIFTDGSSSSTVRLAVGAQPTVSIVRSGNSVRINFDASTLPESWNINATYKITRTGGVNL